MSKRFFCFCGRMQAVTPVGSDSIRGGSTADAEGLTSIFELANGPQICCCRPTADLAP